MTCFADINVSQGSVATYMYARRGGIFNMHSTANLPRNLPVKKVVNRSTFDRFMVMTLSPRFWRTLYEHLSRSAKIVMQSNYKNVVIGLGRWRSYLILINVFMHSFQNLS